jgi:hypothetical protein
MKNSELTDDAFHEHEIQEREHARWLAYQKEGLTPATIIKREKDWAHASLTSALENWQRCMLYAVLGGIATGISAAVLIMMYDSKAAIACCAVGMVLGIGALALFAKQAFRKPVMHKSRSWLLAEQQLSAGK